MSDKWNSRINGTLLDEEPNLFRIYAAIPEDGVYPFNSPTLSRALDPQFIRGDDVRNALRILAKYKKTNFHSFEKDNIPDGELYSIEIVQSNGIIAVVTWKLANRKISWYEDSKFVQQPNGTRMLLNKRSIDFSLGKLSIEEYVDDFIITYEINEDEADPRVVFISKTMSTNSKDPMVTNIFRIKILRLDR